MRNNKIDVSKAVPKNRIGQSDPSITLWSGGIRSQEGGEVQATDAAGNPVTDADGPVMVYTQPTGMVVRQTGNGIQCPFWPILEMVEASKFPSLIKDNIGELTPSLRYHAYGFDIVTEEVDGEFLPVFNVDGERKALAFREAYRDSQDVERIRILGFGGYDPILKAFVDGEPVEINQDAAMELLNVQNSGMQRMTANYQFGQARSVENAVRDKDYIGVLPKYGWPTKPGTRTLTDGTNIDTNNTDWDLCRALEDTAILLVTHSKAFAAAMPTIFGPLPDYVKPISEGGFVPLASNAPSILARKREEAKTAATGTGGAPTNKVVTLPDDIPDTSRDLLEV